MGLAGSMGQFLLTAGTEGKRFSLPHAQILMHQGSAGFGGTAADVEIYAEQLDRLGTTVLRLTSEHTGQPLERIERDSTLPDLAVQAKEVSNVRAGMDEILSRHTGHPVRKIREDTDRSMTLSAVDAVAYGLADRVIERRPQQLRSAA